MTLFFLQLFQTLTTNGDSVFGHNLTGGPNGINNVDPFSLFGHQLVVQHQGVFAVSYLYVALGFFAVVFVALRFVNHSRTGRAWRSLREDPLAAEAMGMPVNRLKLLSFAFGAAVAALTGTLFASLSASVFPLTFYFVLLITVYTMVILGGSGSQAGVVLGALIIGPLLEVLRDPGKSRGLFFVALVAGVVLMSIRRSRAIGIVGVATLIFGFVVHEIAGSLHSSWVVGQKQSGFAGVFDHWVVAPAHLAGWIPPTTYIGADRGGPARERRPRVAAARPARADDLPGRVRLGERDAREAGACALHRARHHPDRADDPAAERAAGRAPSRDRLVEIV